MDTKELSEWLGYRLDKIDSKQDTTSDHLSQIDVTLAKNTADMAHHIKRTDILENQIKQVAADVRPIREHVQRLKGATWVIGLAVAAVELALRLLHD